MKAKLLGFVLVGIMSTVLTAATPNTIDTIEAQYNHCMDNPENSTASFYQCIDEGYKAADSELNKVYNEIKKAHSKNKDEDDKEILKRLVASERAWIAYRDTNCSLGGIQMLNGSGEGLMVSGCLVTETIARVRALKALFEQ